MQNTKTRLILHNDMNITLPGYDIVFVDSPPPKKPKKEEVSSWVLKLPLEGFPSKELRRSPLLKPNIEGGQAEPFSSFKNFPPPFDTGLLEADLLKEGAYIALMDEEVVDESQLPEAELLEEGEGEEMQEQLETREVPSFQLRPRFCFNAKPKPREPRIQRIAPEFVSKAHEYSGPLLEEIRCFHGMTLGELADVTRVAQHHLQNIEGEQYDRLPATVYLRGYLKSVARELGLDVQLVSQSYLDRMQQAKS
ncbi:MAG: helix-turn-helix domain-containing protein [Cystobacterineae bacterium]|nr:helix-turn-helix domain-containing protein [Cystobacterineae bacterium]